MTKRVTCPCCKGKGKIEVPVKVLRNVPLEARTARELYNDGWTVRAIAALLGYKHPGSISYLLKQAP